MLRSRMRLERPWESSTSRLSTSRASCRRRPSGERGTNEDESALHLASHEPIDGSGFASLPVSRSPATSNRVAPVESASFTLPTLLCE